MYRALLFLLLGLFNTRAVAQYEVTSRLVLIGNAGEAIKKKSQFLATIKNTVSFDSSTIVIYLGNNTPYPIDTAILRIEADIVSETPAKVFFIPGFNEWAKGKEPGYKAIQQQQSFIKSLKSDNIKFYPANGCPGPKEIELPNDVDIVVVNTQWWLHEHSKPDLESECKYRTEEEVLREIEDMIKSKVDKMIVVITHHPMKSTGVHSGTFGLKQHIFPLTDIRYRNNFYLPLPVVGSLYPVARNFITTKQDMNNGRYKAILESGIGYVPGIKKALIEHPHTIYVSGQERSLQLLTEQDVDFITSGAALGGGRVWRNKDTKFASSSSGFAVIEILKQKKAIVKFYELNGDKADLKYESEIADFSKMPELAEDTAKMKVVTADSFTTAIDKKIAHTTFLQRVLIGENYRKEWGTPVKMKVFHIDEEMGGFKIKGIGGGHESQSLKLEDKDGKEWALRSITKNLEPVIQEGFQQTIASDVIQDLLSGMHPYGALIVPGLLKPLDIPHATPHLFFVPNDTALKEFRPLFANKVMQLEERKPAINKNKLQSFSETINDMISEGDHLSDQKSYLKIRLVDFLIADFDRHDKQYSWGYTDTAGRKFYYPIPKDRDQAFYANKGLIMAIARLQGFSFMVNFKRDIGKISRSGKIGAYVDMYFTNSLTEEDWKNVLYEFKTKLTDSDINKAVLRLPPEINAIRGTEINDNLIKRRDDIAARGLSYYYYLSDKVNILGGNKDEYFKVSDSGDGILVQVFNKDIGDMKYSRLFDPTITKEIRLYGFNGNDKFEISKNVTGKTRFRIVGGKGNDSFDVKGKVRNYLYDLSTEDNKILSRRRTSKYFASSSYLNEFELKEQIHPSFNIPTIILGSNADDGILAGLKFRYKTFSFKKVPYGSNQTLSGIWSVTNDAYVLKYTGTFVDVFRHFSLDTRAELANPTLTYFFGYGNESKLNKLAPLNYYMARYDYFAADVLAKRRFLNDTIMSIGIGPTIYSYWYDPVLNNGRILENTGIIGLPTSAIHASKQYGGGKMNVTLDNVDNELMPTQGINWNTEFTVLKALSDNASPLTKLYSTMDIYALLSGPDKLFLTMHFGGGHIFSKHFEYFQAFTLGGNNYLRGFRMNRFAGSSIAYGSAELKVKLFDFNAYIMKADVGLVGFTDLGRVWMNGEYSKKWHTGYGGGIYLTPFHSVMLSLVVGLSEEEQLLNASFGSRINMVFQGW